MFKPPFLIQLIKGSYHDLMKILYAIQATGNGHLSRATEIIPFLKKYAEVDLLVSGIQGDLSLPYPIKYNKYGISFIFGKKGGVDVFDTFKRLKLINFVKDVRSDIISDYDLVINDFEPITAWACKLKNKRCIGLSHQAAYLSKKVPKPKDKYLISGALTRNYAPVAHNIAFHFKSYDDFIHTPIIRKEIRSLQPTLKKHYTVYLPAVGDDFIIQHVSKIKEVDWHIFSKHTIRSYNYENVFISPITNIHWFASISQCKGVIMGAGFEGPAEALFLKKKLLVVPMYNQYEQLCNALALQELGVHVVYKLDNTFYKHIINWIQTAAIIDVDYPDQTEQIVSNIFEHARV